VLSFQPARTAQDSTGVDKRCRKREPRAREIANTEPKPKHVHRSLPAAAVAEPAITGHLPSPTSIVESVADPVNRFSGA
jgi:hypothetical protein